MNKHYKLPRHMTSARLIYLFHFIVFFSSLSLPGKLFAQFHPAISPVLRSTTTSTIDYVIQDPGEVVNLSGNLSVGIIDSVSKSTLYDTAYFNDNCPFGGNTYLRIEEHPKGGYVVAGFLNECDRGEAIITWLDDTLGEVNSYTTPTGFQGTFPQFVNLAIDEAEEKIYALKEYGADLFSDGTRPLLLYTFTDSLELLRVDTVVKDQIGDPPSDFNMNEGVMTLSYSTLSPAFKCHLLFYDLNSYSINWDSTLPGINFIADVLCKPNGVFTLERNRSSFQFPPQSSLIREYSYEGVSKNQITIKETESWISIGNFIRTKGAVNCLIYESINYEFLNGDSTAFYRSECLIFDNDLKVLNEFYIDWGKLYITDMSGYSFYFPKGKRIDANYIYYNQTIKRDTNSSYVNYLNRISLDYALSTQEQIIAPNDYFHFQPNPAKNYIQIQYHRPNELGVIEIRTLQGQIIREVFLEEYISLDQLVAGTYIIVAKSKSGEILQRNLFIHI